MLHIPFLIAILLIVNFNNRRKIEDDPSKSTKLELRMTERQTEVNNTFQYNMLESVKMRAIYYQTVNICKRNFHCAN